MSKIDFLKEQIIEARTFVNRLMSELPEDLWYVIPEGTDSNFIWQVGHLLVSQNFHTLTAVTGVNEKVGRLVPIQKYNRIFNGMGTLHRSIEEGLIPVAELREQTEIIHQICIENLETLNDDVLAECLQPLPFKHPVAETKYEALSWSFKHEMWHSAEMEAIKRDISSLRYEIRDFEDAFEKAQSELWRCMHEQEEAIEGLCQEQRSHLDEIAYNQETTSQALTLLSLFDE